MTGRKTRKELPLTADGTSPSSEGGGEMVTYTDLFAFATLIVAIIALVLSIVRDK